MAGLPAQPDRPIAAEILDLAGSPGKEFGGVGSESDSDPDWIDFDSPELERSAHDSAAGHGAATLGAVQAPSGGASRAWLPADIWVPGKLDAFTFSTDFYHMSCASCSAFRRSFELQNPQAHMESKRDVQSIRTKVVKKKKMVETFGAP